MKLDKDIQHVLGMRWQHHAGRDIPFDCSWTHIHGYLQLYQYFIGLRFKSVVIEGKGKNFIMRRDPADTTRLRRTLLQKIRNDAYLRACLRKIVGSLARFHQSSLRLLRLNVRTMTNRQLAGALEQYYAAFQYTAEGVSTLIELITAYSKLLQHKHQRLDEQTLTLLSTPARDTTPLKEERGFYRMIARIQKSPAGVRSRSSQIVMKSHYKKFRWTSVYIGGDPWSWSTFLQRVREAIRSENPGERLSRLRAQHEMNELNVGQLIKKFSLTVREVSILREMIYYRIEAENVFSHITYSSTLLRAETARRLKLTRTEYHGLKPEEMVAALTGKQLPTKKVIAARIKHYVMVLGRRRCHLFAGNDADAFMRRLSYITTVKKQRSKSSTWLVKGECGSQGNAQGRVRVVRRIEDIGKVARGEILVTFNTTPTFLPAMKKSAAIVTDEGGITCHASIVSRELGIPCVIGTKIATQVLRDGDRVEVDASKGIVRRL